MPNYDELGMILSYRRYLVNPNQETYSEFESYVLRFYDQSPIGLLGLLSRYKDDWIFKVVFWRVLAGPITFIFPSTITLSYYPKTLKWISNKIRRTFMGRWHNDKSEFDNRMKIVLLLINIAEETLSKLKPLEINDTRISGLEDIVTISKFLIKNISVDFDNKTIDYYSLFRTLNEISYMINADSTPSKYSLCLSKRFALLWVYLNHIHRINVSWFSTYVIIT